MTSNISYVAGKFARGGAPDAETGGGGRPPGMCRGTDLRLLSARILQTSPNLHSHPGAGSPLEAGGLNPSTAAPDLWDLLACGCVRAERPKSS